MKIELVSVSVNNPLEAYTFYTEKLGFISRMYVPEAYIAIVASPEQPDGTGLLLEPRGNFGSKEFFDGIYTAKMPVIIFSTDNIQKEYERLKGLGVVFIKEPTKTDWGIEAIFDDTCGNYVQLAQLPKE
jgi:predicted enzyme related to lactoylglutathione lyase